MTDTRTLSGHRKIATSSTLLWIVLWATSYCVPPQLDYNNVRPNSAIGYVTPNDMLAGHQQEIQAERDRKLDAAREQRKNRRQRAA